MYAIIRVAGFQYMVKEGEKISVPRMAAEPGSTVNLGDVLFLRTADQTIIGRPAVANASVQAEVLSHDRTKKVRGFKFRRREKYRRKLGHRQDVTTLRVTRIAAG